MARCAMRSRRPPSSSTIDMRRSRVDVARVAVPHLLEKAVVDLVDDLQMPRQHPLEQG